MKSVMLGYLLRNLVTNTFSSPRMVKMGSSTFGTALSGS